MNKAGRPYIEYRKRVMQAMSDDAGRIVAILHDVVEDTDLTFDQLAAEGFPDDIFEALDSMTRRSALRQRQSLQLNNSRSRFPTKREPLSTLT